MKLKRKLLLFIAPLLLTSCGEKTFEKDYMEYIYGPVSQAISKFDINNYSSKTVGLGSGHNFKKFDYNGDEFNKIINNNILPNSEFYETEVGDGFYNPYFIQFYNNSDDFRFKIMVIKDTLCSSKYFTDRYCYYLFFKEKEGVNKYYLGASKDISIYNDLLYLHDIAVKNTYGDPIKHEC